MRLWDAMRLRNETWLRDVMRLRNEMRLRYAMRLRNEIRLREAMRLRNEMRMHNEMGCWAMRCGCAMRWDAAAGCYAAPRWADTMG